MSNATIASQNEKGYSDFAKNPSEANTPKPDLFQADSLLGALTADATMRFEARRDKKPIGAVTGFNSLNERLGGALMPGLHLVHGSPGIGKTAFVLQVAATCQCPAMIVTCEMTPLELLRRIIARTTNTYLGNLKDGSLHPSIVVAKANEAAKYVSNLMILDATQVPAKPEHIQTAFQTTRRLDPENPHALLIVDSLHSWSEGMGGGEEYDRVNESLASLRAFASRFEVPVLAVSERNRASMKSSGQNSGASSRKLEYSAETVVGLDALNVERDGTPIYNSDSETEVKLLIGKNRHGSTATPLSLMFSGRLQSYREL